MHTIQNSKDTKRSKSLIYTPNFHVLLSSQTDFPFWLLLPFQLPIDLFALSSQFFKIAVFLEGSRT